MKNKCLFPILIFLIFTSMISCANSYINKSDNIKDSDEKIIKEFRSDQNYSNEDLKNLSIQYLGEVDGYSIYFVPFKGSSGILNENGWTKGNYTFPIESHIRILGIKDHKLFTLGNLIYETTINIEALYNILPEYK